MFPAVVKKVFKAAAVPVNVRAVPVPPTVTPPPVVAFTAPSGIDSVTVRLPVSTSANGLPVYVRFPATSSVTVNVAGALSVGASFTAVTFTVIVFAAASNVVASRTLKVKVA